MPKTFGMAPKSTRFPLKEWHRLLAAGGFMTLANPEGQGAIDDGGQADITAIRYTQEQIQTWVAARHAHGRGVSGSRAHRRSSSNWYPVGQA